MRTLGIVMVTIGLAVTAGIGARSDAEVAAAKDEVQFRKQIATVANIRSVALAIEVYRDDHSSVPPTLQSLLGEYVLTDEFFRDGWGQPLYYYTSGQQYVVASFGRDGQPTAQASNPGRVSEQIDYDEDIVMVSDEWAQTPYGVDS